MGRQELRRWFHGGKTDLRRTPAHLQRMPRRRPPDLAAAATACDLARSRRQLYAPMDCRTACCGGGAVRPDPRRGAVRSIAVAAAAALVLTMSGAFGTGNEAFGKRLIYWSTIMAVGSAWGQLCQQLLTRLLNGGERPALHIAALTATVAGPICLFVWAATGLFFEGRLYPFEYLPRFAMPVLTVAASVSALVVLLGQAAPVQTHASAGPATPVKVLEPLPPRLRGGRLIAVEAEDHCLRIHSGRGSDLILMRLSDALGELEGLEGAQTHRSWWVAKDSVEGASRRDGRATLSLAGGLAAPVSRRYARALRDAGWY